MLLLCSPPLHACMREIDQVVLPHGRDRRRGAVVVHCGCALVGHGFSRLHTGPLVANRQPEPRTPAVAAAFTRPYVSPPAPAAAGAAPVAWPRRQRHRPAGSIPRCGQLLIWRWRRHVGRAAGEPAHDAVERARPRRREHWRLPVQRVAAGGAYAGGAEWPEPVLLPEGTPSVQ